MLTSNPLVSPIVLTMSTVLVQAKANSLQNGSYIYGISSMGDEAKKALADGVS